jgi:hypothetical protein
VALFVKPVVQDLVVARSIFEVFGQTSGLHVNYDRSEAVVIQGGVEDRMVVRHMLHCNLGNFPCRYLGLQLSTTQMSRAHWQPILDKVIAPLPAW